jgi:hypothetical protein
MDLLNDFLLNNIKNINYIFINNLEDFTNINYFVWTFSKTGTSSLATALQVMHDGTKIYKNVVHCHTEDCWKNFFNIDNTFDIMNIVNYQKRKPIIFQLYRNPIERLISEYYHIKHADVNLTDDINVYLKNKIEPYFEYYEKKFDFKFTDIEYDKINKFCFIEKDNFYLYFTALEHFDKLKNNLIRIFNCRGFNFDSFNIECLHSNSYDKSKIKIDNEIIETLFENNKSIINFYYTEDEIINFKNLYKNI